MKLQSARRQQKNLSVVAYTGGFALVREMRYLKSEQAVEEVQFMDVAERVETDSIVVKGLDILEQNYDYDLISKGKLLERYINRNVHVRNAETGEEMEIRLLSVAECIIGERTDTKEIVVDPIGELILPALPEGLLLKPALIWKIEPALLDQEIMVSYLTKSLEWHAHYTLEIKDEQFQFDGWVKILNHSGAHYENAQLALVAGVVHREEEMRNGDSRILYSRMQAPSIATESLPERFVYRIGRPVTVMNEQLKQLALLSARGSDFKRTYHIRAGDTYAKVELEFPNTEENGLGMPLPEGLVKVYESGDFGEVFFTGEDHIDHTAVSKNVRVDIGKALDIESKSYEKLREKHGVHEYITYVYELENRKVGSTRVFVNHAIYERVWEMESSTHDYERQSSSEVEFIIRVQPATTVELEFTYKVDKRAEERVY
ncbi:DUF4139 domain-containing protein [Planococcus sp. ISL-109]|uniref:DUF4139 domain-containing protein n=1 Tax=Planococcus sp. ISL-109 TaxID=2819166 RepID=UPI001BE92155|nr:DUF4139 domain-containing protein [Planococcus sp. ISL-109]MBT2581455.1 DUF4139 domain-containing protein [Planococcus sp. ISL-109]